MKRLLRVAFRLLLLLLFLTLLNIAVAGWLLWRTPSRLAGGLAGGGWPFDGEKVSVDLTWGPGEHERSSLHLQALRDGGRFRLAAEHGKHRAALAAGDTARVWGNLGGKGGDYSAAAVDFSNTLAALADAADLLDEFGPGMRLLALAAARPMIGGFSRSGDGWEISIRLAGGEVAIRDGWWHAGSVELPGEKGIFKFSLRRSAAAAHDYKLPETAAEEVPADELDKAIAAVIELAALQARPIKPPEDGFRREGKGWLRIVDGRRLAYFEGDPMEIGYQHGKLLAEPAGRVIERLFYGMGLYYSLKEGDWFPRAARELVELQRPYIDEVYIEEMKGFAEGSGQPLELVQAANLFPEFFHCSGVAVFGRATEDGRLLHARVLDYMTNSGLQDEEVIMGIRRTGALPWINVSYAGFLGSVTGMNSERIVIGEMGGSGEGQWDGTPMSFLIRGALENARSLDETIAWFRDRKRTCEFYYVFSDSKIPDAVGIAATPDELEVVRAGRAHPKLNDPLADTVLLSSGSRYRRLVERVREHYGRINAEVLIDIIDRPVSMRSNLHNAVFEPDELRTWVFQAGRHTPACKQDPLVVEWRDLFTDCGDGI